MSDEDLLSTEGGNAAIFETVYRERARAGV